MEVLSIDVSVTATSPGKNRPQGIVAAKVLLSDPFWPTYITQRTVLQFCKEKKKRMLTAWVTCDTESKMEVIVQGWGLLLRWSVETKGKTQDWAEEKRRDNLVYRKPQLTRVVWRWPDPSEIPQVEARDNAGHPEKGVSYLEGWFFHWQNPQGDLTTEACLLAALLIAEEINPSFLEGEQDWNIDLCYWWKAFEFFLTFVSRLSASSNPSWIQLPKNSWRVYEIARPPNSILNQILQFKLNCLFFLPYPLL